MGVSMDSYTTESCTTSHPLQITISEDFEIELSTVKGSDGLEYRYITPETLKEVTDLVSAIFSATYSAVDWPPTASSLLLPSSAHKVAASIRDLGQDANCSLICEGALHLRHYLHRRARQKDIELDPAYYTYFDLHTEFHKTFPRTPGDSLEEMARCILDCKSSSLRRGDRAAPPPRHTLAGSSHMVWCVCDTGQKTLKCH